MTSETVSPSSGLLSRDSIEGLKAIARSRANAENDQVALPELQAVSELVSKVAPARNAMGVIFSGWQRIAGRRLPPGVARQDINRLFDSLSGIKDGTLLATIMGAPAVMLWFYQQMVRLSGKEMADAFPDGTWQFYVEYSMREDTARHANETRGFDAALRRQKIALPPADRVTAWVMAAIHCLHNYNALLENEWRERAAIEALRVVTESLPDAEKYARLYRSWETKRPFDLPAEAGEQSYVAYRRQVFNQFMAQATTRLPDASLRVWAQKLRGLEASDLRNYQRQMSILAYLDPGPYNETRTPIPLEKAHIGLIYQGRYFLIPVCQPDQPKPPSIQALRAQITDIFQQPPSAKTSESLIPLAEIRRSEWPALREKLSTALVSKLDALRYAPILLNCDPRPRNQPLAELRLAERGIGDHALTIFDTSDSFVFDQSHIFFDGVWGAALAEIITDEATYWGIYLGQNPNRASSIRKAIARLQGRRIDPPPRSLEFRWGERDTRILQHATRRLPEAAAETEDINLPAIIAQRDLMRKRNNKLRLTINDFLVLYRAIHALTYRPDAGLLAELGELKRTPATAEAAQLALEALDPNNQVNPSMLIPVDASQRAPRDRLQPMNYEVPLADLKVLRLHADTLLALQAYKNAKEHERAALSEKFEQLQREYLAMLAGFGETLSKAKEIALRGESAAIGSMKLLAHVPAPVQSVLQKIPTRFDVLNDLIQGREVFSNIGAVAATSSLTRFITAKDDHGKKTLAWGVLTDAEGILRVSLRDFRPHVPALAALGRLDVAHRIAQHYLDAYAEGLNNYIRDLRHIMLAG